MSLTRISADDFDLLIDAVSRLSAGQGAEALDATYLAILNGTNTTEVFKNWWPLSVNGTETKYDRLTRFAKMLAECWSDKVYTLRYYKQDVSSSPVMTPLDDLEGRTAAQLCTDETDTVADWADEDPMTWYVRANALSLADGTMDILAVEGVDPNFDIYGNIAPVYTFCIALNIREWTDGDYEYKSWCTSERGGYHPYGGDVDPNNQKRALTWHPTFPGGYDSQGRLGSGKDQKPYNRRSANQGIASARTVTAYEGLWNDADAIWALDMWQLRHWNLENTGICPGCVNYNYQYYAAVSESDTTRILMTAANAAYYQEGSNVQIGDSTSTDRNAAATYALGDNVTILSKEEVTVDGTAYVALNLDLDTGIDVTAGTTRVHTAPWNSGNTEKLPGRKDGCCYNLTAGRNPLRIQGVEMLSGAYDVGLDPLYQVTNLNSSVSPVETDFEVFECRDSENLAGSITSDYVSTGIKFYGFKYTWNYVKKFVRTKLAVLFPEVVGGSTSTYYKSGFYGASSAGVRCPWRCGHLYSGAFAGLACESGNFAPSLAYWSGRPRLCGSGKKRGEWAGA